MNSYNFKLLNATEGQLLSEFPGQGVNALEAFENAVNNGCYIPSNVDLIVVARNANNPSLRIRFDVLKDW